MEELKPEILIEILHWLSYADLRLRVCLVSKRFNEIITRSPNSRIEKCIFRDSLSRTLIGRGSFLDRREYTLHPILEYRASISPDDCSTWSVRHLELDSEYPILRDNFISPPSSRVCLYGGLVRHHLDRDRESVAITVNDMVLMMPEIGNPVLVKGRNIDEDLPQLASVDGTLNVEAILKETYYLL